MLQRILSRLDAAGYDKESAIEFRAELEAFSRTREEAQLRPRRA
jgi:hypothetical protein